EQSNSPTQTFYTRTVITLLWIDIFVNLYFGLISPVFTAWIYRRRTKASTSTGSLSSMTEPSNEPLSIPVSYPTSRKWDTPLSESERHGEVVNETQEWPPMRSGPKISWTDTKTEDG